MNNTGKTITAITTAAAIGTGVLLTTTRETAPVEQEQPPAQVEFVDNIKPIEVPIFTVDIPSIVVPKVEIFGVEIPNVENLNQETITVATHLVEKLGVENLSHEQIRVLVTIVDTVEVAGYSIETVKIATQVVESVGVENLSPEQIRIILQTISNLDGDVPKIQALQRVLAATIKDKRMLQSDTGLSIYNPILDRWLEIYNAPLPPPIDLVSLPAGVRMIAELRSSTYAEHNLNFYRQAGYNACLIPITGTENIADIMQLIQMVRRADMSPWFTWSGPESLRWSIYQDPAKLASMFQLAATQCDGYIAAWRRTSAHLVMQDEAYMEYLVTHVRNGNPSIYIVGESYYGETWENLPHIDRQGWVARNNIVRNQSGILICGIATYGFSVKLLLENTFSEWIDTPKLGVVLGDRPYYASRANTNKSFKDNLKIKQNLEARFIKAGCVGTVTIHGDVSELGTSLQTTDDIGKYKIE